MTRDDGSKVFHGDIGLGETSCVYSLTLDNLKIDNEGYIYYESRVGRNEYLYTFSGGNGISLSTASAVVGGWEQSSYTRLKATQVAKDVVVDVDGYAYIEQSIAEDNEACWIQMGANAGEGMFLNLVNATAKGVGITDPTLDVTSYDEANTSISRLDNAINQVSGYRSHFGVQQNRMEYAKSVNDNTAENTQYAESGIRDTNMAEEMVAYSKHSILEQVGQSVLAQANQSVQGVISLLQ